MFMSIIMFTMMINMIFIMLIHPSSITLLIILQTFMIYLISGLTSYSFWFFNMLFLIFLEGMLFLFIYITSLASNELFQLPTKTIIMTSITTMFMLPLTLLFNQIPSPFIYKYDSTDNNFKNMTMENYFNQLYIYPNLMLTILTIINYINHHYKDYSYSSSTITSFKLMNKPMRTNHPLFKIINKSLIDLPTPSNIATWWNFGSLLGLCLMIQMMTGIFLAMHYTAHINLAFNSVSPICRDV